MRKYRIAELYNQYSIEVDDGGDKWVDAYMLMPRVPKFFDSLADARSWVATIKRGVVYHDAEAPPLSESNLQWECARDFRIFRKHDAEDAPKVRTLSSIFEDVDAELAVWMEMDNDMQSSNVPTDEISGLLARWHNKYTITCKDAPNLAQDERKAEGDASNGIKPLEWFEERVDDTIIQIETIKNTAWISDYSIAKAFHRFQTERGYRYKDQ
jgi:hypothetical protein